MIHIIRSRATPEQIEEMLEAHEIVIKVAVDVQRGLLAGGGSAHYECESALLADGSRQQDIWGANWLPVPKQIEFESLINIRPRQNNYGMIVSESAIRHRIAEIVRQLLEGV